MNFESLHMEYFEVIERELNSLGVTKENIDEYTFVMGSPSKEIQELALAFFGLKSERGHVIDTKWLLKRVDLEQYTKEKNMRTELGPFSIGFLETLLVQAKSEGAVAIRIDVDKSQSIDGRGKVHLIQEDGKIIKAVQYVIKPGAKGETLERHVISSEVPDV